MAGGKSGEHHEASNAPMLYRLMAGCDRARVPAECGPQGHDLPHGAGLLTRQAGVSQETASLESEKFTGEAEKEASGPRALESGGAEPQVGLAGHGGSGRDRWGAAALSWHQMAGKISGEASISKDLGGHEIASSAGKSGLGIGHKTQACMFEEGLRFKQRQAALKLLRGR